MCLIVHWFFIVDFVELKLLRFAQAQAEPPAPEANAEELPWIKPQIKLIEQIFNNELKRIERTEISYEICDFLISAISFISAGLLFLSHGNHGNHRTEVDGPQGKVKSYRSIMLLFFASFVSLDVLNYPF